MTTTKTTLLATTLGLGAAIGTAAAADPVEYTLDPSHSAAMFHYTHAGYSTTYGIVTGIEGTVMYDAEDPANSSVSVELSLENFDTGWDDRDEHFLQSGDFFDPELRLATFESTGIEVTGETTAEITGDLTLNGITNEVVLDTTLNNAGEYPLPPFQGQPAIGLTATTTVLRSDFGVGAFAPMVSDEVQVEVSIEAMAPAEES